MHVLDLTLPAPEENLALDEALLEECEQGKRSERKILRFWESSRYFVALGYSNKILEETYAEKCASLGVPILRRVSGGGTVLQGPGCLNFSLILPISDGASLEISQTNCHVLGTHKKALAPLLDGAVDIKGTSDLTWRDLKFSGNAQRRKSRYLLFHGTFLYRFDISYVEKVLRLPTREPDYRKHRAHADFIANIPLSAEKIKEALRKAWQVSAKSTHIPEEEVKKLVRKKYSHDAWNRKF